jgi:hypothetical protein
MMERCYECNEEYSSNECISCGSIVCDDCYIRTSTQCFECREKEDDENRRLMK